MAEDATYLEVVHEYAHITHAERIGTQQYAFLSSHVREQEAFDLVRTYFWDYPSQLEKNWLIKNLSDYGGTPW